VAQSSVDPLCNDPDWALAHADAWAAPESVFGISVAAGDGAPLAVLPLKLEPSRGRMALRRAILLPDGSFDSDYLEIPARSGSERVAIGAALDELARVRRVDAAVLACMPEGSATLAAVRGWLDERGLPRRETSVPCAAAPLPRGFEDYLSALKPRMRSKVRSAIRAAESRGAAFAWCDDEASLPGHLERLFELHTARWRAVGEPGSFADERRRRFYAELAPRAARAGRLRFSRLEVDGSPVAYQFGMRAGSAYYQIQEGYDPELGGERVGTALRGLSIRALIEEGVASYDFMAGLSRHKTDWGAEERRCTTIAFALPRLRARVAYRARMLVDRWRGRTDAG
jgi:CelD/BcsL family acetyltransferase involved in cellulose biosynthesis